MIEHTRGTNHEGWINVYRNIETGCFEGDGLIHNSKTEAEEERLQSPSYECVSTIKIEWGEELKAR